ncbi:MAG: autotransporter outer membrane beta-barrel domain-containing protein, partial [Candidatus Schmidhempelia sp.]|nr:autotransporter outer membrane beta-barrel domain-containing protein [Candidatus Schmidhempelia sp.]
MNDISTKVRGSNNIAEIKVGLEARIKGRLHAWGSISQQLGQHEQRDTQGIAGIKYTF